MANRTGEYLRVVELKRAGYRDDMVDATRVSADREARELADRRYTSGK